ncbi:MAG TPA: protein kinase, partial [Bacteroidota bacterium]|nr:protein kinase [Bacteroidota bacterium]
MIGQTISHYKILEKIGEGGMGIVYKAEDTKLHRPVALKFLPPNLTRDEPTKARFIHEARAASGLDHPNIGTIFEINETDDGRMFIAMAYYAGETLKTKIERGALEIKEAIQIAEQVSEGLSRAHEAGISHRDVKPANIIITERGEAKIVDFGLAKLAGQSKITKTGTTVGTVAYMSPEQALGETVDHRTDIWSLGVVLYEMLTGQMPFKGEYEQVVLYRLMNEEPEHLTRLRPEVPMKLEQIVEKALAKNPDRRLQKADEITADLKSLLKEMEAGAAKRRLISWRIPRKTKRYVYGAVTVAVAAIVAIRLLLPSRETKTIHSIAVLPFENMTRDQSTEYLSDGVTESLINSLSKLPNVKVIARYSVFSYKNQPIDLPKVSEKLGVRSILTGRVLMQGESLDVRAELTDVEQNIQLWGDHFIRKAGDVFTVQDEIAQQVTDALRIRLTMPQQEQVSKRYTENAEAYRLYLQGRYYFTNFSEENLERANQLFDQAIALDSRYALAYAARAETFFSMGDLLLPMSKATSKAKQDIESALSIDDELVQARTVNAIIEFQYDWDFPRAEKDFQQVIASNANYAEAHHNYGWFLSMMGRTTEALAEMTIAQQLDPVNLQMNVDRCLPHSFARQYDECVAISRKALEMFPNSRLPHMTLGNALVFEGEYAAGIKELEKASALDPAPHQLGNLGYAYAKAGRKAEARKLLAELKELSKGRYVSPYFIALICAGLGEKDQAFAWLEKAYQQRSFFLLFMKMDPAMDNLRADARFNDLMRR